jgi:hypothetical protein
VVRPSKMASDVPGGVDSLQPVFRLSFAFITINPTSRAHDALEELAGYAGKLDKRLLSVENAETARSVPGFHVSLTRPVFLLLFQFDSFIRMLKDRLRHVKRCVSSIEAREKKS